jgi:hypothetical protein
MDERILPRLRDLLMGGEVAACREIAPGIAALAPAELQIVVNRIYSGSRYVRIHREIPSLIEAAIAPHKPVVAGRPPVTWRHR